jgi:hypothetical protein
MKVSLERLAFGAGGRFATGAERVEDRSLR